MQYFFISILIFLIYKIWRKRYTHSLLFLIKSNLDSKQTSRKHIKRIVEIASQKTSAVDRFLVAFITITTTLMLASSGGMYSLLVSEKASIQSNMQMMLDHSVYFKDSHMSSSEYANEIRNGINEYRIQQQHNSHLVTHYTTIPFAIYTLLLFVICIPTLIYRFKWNACYIKATKILLDI